MQLKYPVASNGFSIIEVMITVAIIAALGAAIYKLQLTDISSTQQITTRQLMMQSAINLSNKIYANSSYCATNATSRRGGCTAADGTNNYTETNYTDDTTLTTPNCSGNLCTEAQLAKFILFQWKSSLTVTNMNIPTANIFAIICRDSSLAIPTTAGANCNGSGGLVIKMAWQSHIETAELTTLGNNNYLILPLAQR